MIATPQLDEWTEGVIRQLAPRGAKVQLARHLAAQYGGCERAWQVTLTRILKRRLAPNGEVLLAINAWLDSNPLSGRHPESQTGPRV